MGAKYITIFFIVECAVFKDTSKNPFLALTSSSSGRRKNLKKIENKRKKLGIGRIVIDVIYRIIGSNKVQNNEERKNLHKR